MSGSWLGFNSDVLYTITLTRAETPTHLPPGELKRAGVCARVDGATGASRPLDSSSSSGGEFSVEEHVGRRVRPLGQDLLDEHVLVIEAGVHGDPGLLLERRDQRIGGLHVLAAVEGQRLARPRGGAAAGYQQPPGHPQCGSSTPPSPQATA